MIVNIIKKARLGLCRLLEATLILAVLILVIDILWGVLTRWSGSFVVWLADRGIEAWTFLPRGQNELTEEIARFLLVWVGLLGGAVAFGEKGHLGVDYFVGKLHPSAQKLMGVFSLIVVMVFAVTIFIYGGGRITLANMDQIAPALGPEIGLKMGHVYMSLPIAGIFFLLFAVEQLIETLVSTSVKEGE